MLGDVVLDSVTLLPMAAHALLTAAGLGLIAAARLPPFATAKLAVLSR